MKWLLLVIVLLVVGAALYLRTVRSRPSTAPSRQHHRLDDSATSEHPQRSRPDTYEPGDDDPLRPGEDRTT